MDDLTPGADAAAAHPRLGGAPEQRRAFDDYARAFSAADLDRAGGYYTDDIVCQVAGMVFEGKAALVGFYREMFKRVRERLTLHQLVADEHGMVADITSTFTAVEDASDFAPMPLKTGEVREAKVFVFYTLRDGLIARIRVARQP